MPLGGMFPGSPAAAAILVPPADQVPPGSPFGGMAGSEVGKSRYPDPSTLKIAVVPRPSGVNPTSAKCVASGDKSAKSSTPDRIRCLTVSPASIRYTLPLSAPGRNRVKTMAWARGDAVLARESASAATPHVVARSAVAATSTSGVSRFARTASYALTLRGSTYLRRSFEVNTSSTIERVSPLSKQTLNLAYGAGPEKG
jgi:hypothetical protein